MEMDLMLIFIRKRIVIVAAGGTGLAPVKGLWIILQNIQDKCKSFKLIAGFKSPK